MCLEKLITNGSVSRHAASRAISDEQRILAYFWKMVVTGRLRKLNETNWKMIGYVEQFDNTTTVVTNQGRLVRLLARSCFVHSSTIPRMRSQVRVIFRFMPTAGLAAAYVPQLHMSRFHHHSSEPANPLSVPPMRKGRNREPRRAQWAGER